MVGVLAEICYKRAHELYGEELPIEVKERLSHELEVVKNDEVADSYYEIYRLKQESGLEDWQYYARATGASSFLIYLCNLVGNINPLFPHYRCEEDKYSEFPASDKKIKMGIQLPDKICPICGKWLKKAGFGLDFEMIRRHKVGNLPLLVIGVPEQKYKALKAMPNSLHKDWVISTKLITLLDCLVCETGFDPKKISLEDEKVLELLRQPNAKELFGCKKELKYMVGDVKSILELVQPNGFEDFVRILGLAGQMFGAREKNYELLQEGYTLQELITSKDDLYEHMLELGLEPEEAMQLTKDITKKLGLSEKTEQVLQGLGYSERYLELCKLLTALMPRAQYILYATLIWQIGYYRIHFPEAYERAYAKYLEIEYGEFRERKEIN